MEEIERKEQRRIELRKQKGEIKEKKYNVEEGQPRKEKREKTSEEGKER